MIQFGSRQSIGIRVMPLAGVPSEEDHAARATWVSLELWVNGKNLSVHTHEDDQTVHSGLHWPGVFLARWFVRAWQGFYERSRWPIATRQHASSVQELVRHWDRLIADNEPPDDVLDARDEFVATHFLEAGAGGGLVPGVCFSRDGDRMTISWDSQESAPPWVFFHQGVGCADVDVGQFAEVVNGFVDWVRDRLCHDSADFRELGAWLDDFGSPAAATRMLWAFAGIDGECRDELCRRVGRPEELFCLPDDWVVSRERGRTDIPAAATIAGSPQRPTSQ